VFMYVYNNMQ